jgi:hypothetical protein
MICIVFSIVSWLSGVWMDDYGVGNIGLGRSFGIGLGCSLLGYINWRLTSCDCLVKWNIQFTSTLILSTMSVMKPASHTHNIFVLLHLLAHIHLYSYIHSATSHVINL